MKRFPKKRVFITGGGSGLGRGLSLEFARLGWNVCVGDIHHEGAEETVERAEKENVPLLGTALTAFEFVGRLYERGIKGS